ncbi:MAG TPA: FAD binding domain-containing protein, partial [Gaiellaceae bacterium]|nr:FAD binding domain-containing protein [Gaiellaceae bacterium]
MIPAPVGYRRPASLEEALAALAEPEAKALAGGHSLLPLMKLRVARPALLVDLAGLGLSGIEERDGGLAIGALTTWRELAEAEALRRPGLAALADCARAVGDLQVRNRGTIGGSLAHADPAAELPAVAAALGGELVLRSARGERVLRAEDFFVSYLT